jgi:acyl-coenzyme A thioesterase PaaI-like protein
MECTASVHHRVGVSEPAADSARQSRGSNYPPTNHLLRDLQAESVWISEGEFHVYAPMTPEVSNERGMTVGVMAAIIDFAGAQVAMRSVGGDWVATADLSYQPSGGVEHGPLVTSTKLLRAGNRVVVVRTEVFDGRGEETPARHAGSAVMTFSRLPREATTTRVAPMSFTIGERFGLSVGPTGFEGAATDALGLEELAPGSLLLEKSNYVLNSFGTVNGGATAMTLVAAAESMVGAGVAADISIRYVGQAGDGPMRTVARALAAYDSYTSVDVELLDTSEGDRVVALGTVGIVA